MPKVIETKQPENESDLLKRLAEKLKKAEKQKK
jgi:hypothetical protein